MCIEKILKEIKHFHFMTSIALSFKNPYPEHHDVYNLFLSIH